MVIGYSSAFAPHDDDVDYDGLWNEAYEAIETNDDDTIYTLKKGRCRLKAYKLGRRFLARRFVNGRREQEFFDDVEYALDLLIAWYLE